MITRTQGWVIIGMLAVAIVVALVVWKTGQAPERKWTDDLVYCAEQHDWC